MRSLRPLLLLPFFFFQSTLFSQIVWTEPTFPTDNEAVTVFFDATQGSGGLANCNCDVYFHTGLITENSNNSSDWKYVFTTWGQANDDWKMKPVAGQPNVYKWVISPTIRQRYDVTDPTEAIEKLAFVFRNADGSLTGKDTGGTDIFHDISQDNSVFNIGFVKPSTPSVISAIGETILVEGASNQTADLSLYHDGNLLASTTGTSIEFEINVTTIGTHEVELRADNSMETKSTSFTYVAVDDSPVAPLPNGVETGINYLSDSEVTFVLEAPSKQNVFLIGDFNDWMVDTEYQMSKTPDGMFWWISISGLTPGETYAFQYLVDGTIRIGDPYSNLVLDPFNDSGISPEVFPNMHPYPFGKTDGIVSLLQPGTPAYTWQVTDFERPEKTNLVIYELLVRDFLANEYGGITNMLDYFVELGITAIELMPVSESSSTGWGYDPVYHYALEKSYGTPNALKALVDACHARGIAVILDVVFNHAHENNPFAKLFWDEANFRPAPDNPWMNVQAPHEFSVFYDFDHTYPGTQAYVKKTLKHWLEEYKVDGFRFDLAWGFTQKSGNAAWGYDPVRVELLKDYADYIWQISPGAYWTMEHFVDNSERRELSDYGLMSWGGAGIHNQYLEAAMGYQSNLKDASYKTWGWNDPHLVTYIESHDEERMMYKNVQYGNSNGNYNVKDLSTALDRTELANAFFYTIPGPKLLWQFGELGYDYSLHTCEDGVTIDPDDWHCKLSPKPVPWDYTTDPDRVDVYNVIRSLLHLKNNYEVFQTSNFNIDVDQYWKTIHLNHSSMNVAVLGNFHVVNQTFDPKFQHTGTWYEYFSGETLNVTNVNEPVTFTPGEYRLYTDQPVAPPEAVTADEEAVAKGLDWFISPNPTAGEAWISFNLEKNKNVQWKLFDLQGKLLENNDLGEMWAGMHRIKLPTFAKGMYLLQLKADETVDVKKLVVVR